MKKQKYRHSHSQNHSQNHNEAKKINEQPLLFAQNYLMCRLL